MAADQPGEALLPTASDLHTAESWASRSFGSSSALATTDGSTFAARSANSPSQRRLGLLVVRFVVEVWLIGSLRGGVVTLREGVLGLGEPGVLRLFGLRTALLRGLDTGKLVPQGVQQLAQPLPDAVRATLPRTRPPAAAAAWR